MPHFYQPDSTQDLFDWSEYNVVQDQYEAEAAGRELHGIPELEPCDCEIDMPGGHAEICPNNPFAAQNQAWRDFIATSPTWEQIRQWQYP